MQVRLIGNNKFLNIVVILSFIFGAFFLGKNLIVFPQRSVLLLIVSLLFFSFGFVYWKRAVLIVTFFIVFEGALRKWVFPESQQLVYFLKDIILTGVYLRFFCGKIMQHGQSVQPHRVNPWLALLFLWGIVEVFNPLLPSFLVGLLGFKAYFFYIPIFYLLPHLFSKKEELIDYLLVYALCSIPVSILGIAQYFSPLDSPLVTYLGWEEATVSAVSTVGNYPRISGPFSYISGYTIYLSVMALILLALLHVGEKLSNIKKFFLIVALVLVIANTFMTGSRGPIFALIVIAPVFFLMATRFSLWKFLRMFPRLAIGIMIIIFSLSFFFKEAVLAFWERTSTSKDFQARTINTVLTPFSFAKYASASGYGIGITHQAAQFLLEKQLVDSSMPDLDFEGEPERIMLETGIIGFLLFYIMKLILLMNAWKSSRRLNDPDLKILAIVIFLLNVNLFFAPIVFNVTASFYYWFFSGFLLLLPQLDRCFQNDPKFES